MSGVKFYALDQQWGGDCSWFNLEECEQGEAEYVGISDFDRVTAERDAALAQESTLARDAANWKRKACESAEREHELQQRLTAADERAVLLEKALKFYADREHYHFESGNWDTVSGEPLNILWNGDEPDFIEDGSIARTALKPAEGGGDDRPNGCFCPPKGFTGLWAGASCPIHQGLRALKP